MAFWLVGGSVAFAVMHSPMGWASAVVARHPQQTRVTTEANGRAVVIPAPEKLGVSHNVFERFDVDAAGLTFQNQVVKARTLVAEVLSTAPSTLAGTVTLEGPRANLIIANQNGLQINGAAFVNFGSVALTTGSVSFREQTQSAGYRQRYVDVNTQSGRIEIGPEGLSANLVRLELIAKQIAVHGPIHNEFTSSTAQVGLVVGSSTALFDTAASPTDNLTPWIYYGGNGSPAPAAVALDLTLGSSVTAGRVSIRVTDKGAGVRNAGDVLASAGEFVLNSAGFVEQWGGSMRAHGAVNIQADSIRQEVANGRVPVIAAGTQARLEAAGDIVNRGGEIAGTSRISEALGETEAVVIQAGGKIEHSTPIGAVQVAVIHGRADGVRIETQEGVTSLNARVVANGDLWIESPQTVRHETLHLAGEAPSGWRESNVLYSSQARFTDAGRLADPLHQGYWVAQGAVTIGAGRYEQLGAYLFANSGNLSISGRDAVHLQAHAIGQTQFRQKCVLFICRTRARSDESLVGGHVLAAGTVTMRSEGEIINEGGQVLGTVGVELEAPRIAARGMTVHTALLRDRGMKAWFGDTWAQLFGRDQGGSFTAQQGRLILRGNALQEGGRYESAVGVDGTIEVIRLPHRDPVQLNQHLGILRW